MVDVVESDGHELADARPEPRAALVQIQTALERSKINWSLVAGILLMFAVMIYFVKRWFAKQQKAA